MFGQGNGGVGGVGVTLDWERMKESSGSPSSKLLVGGGGTGGESGDVVSGDRWLVRGGSGGVGHQGLSMILESRDEGSPCSGVGGAKEGRE